MMLIKNLSSSSVEIINYVVKTMIKNCNYVKRTIIGQLYNYVPTKNLSKIS